MGTFLAEKVQNENQVQKENQVETRNYIQLISVSEQSNHLQFC